MTREARVKKLIVRALGRRGSNTVKHALDTLRMLAHNKPLVLVYQMGKVGSQSVYYSLLGEGYFPVIHFHYIRDLRKQKFHEYLWLRFEMAKDATIKIITMVREPVARNVSSFAHDFPLYFQGGMQDYSLEELGKMYYEWDRHYDGIRWFDDEFLKSTGVDVFLQPFDQEAGFSTIESGRLSILLLKSEIDVSIQERCIAEFLDIPKFRLRICNTSADRAYKQNYKDFVKYIKFDRNYLDTQYDSKYCRHYYSEREVAGFRERWSKR